MQRTVIVEHLTKSFSVTEKGQGFSGTFSSLLNPKKKIVKAVDDISFSIAEGELVGFIGPNGAGKTTTLKMLSGILHPTSGFVQVLGFTPSERKENFLKKISLIMGQKNQLWWDLPAIETFELNKAIYEIPKKIYKENIEELTALLEIKDLLHTPVRKLSLGQRMRMELVAALLHRPQVLFLDEPTIGLDVIAQQKIREFITDYNRRYKATIILTSHNMDDLVNLTKRVIIINQGTIIFDGALAEIVGKFAKEKIIKITFANQSVNYKSLEKIGEIKEVNLPQITLSVKRNASAMAAAEILQTFPVEDLTIEEEPVESIIQRVFKNASL